MQVSIKDKLLQSIISSRALYHKLILLVGLSGSGKTPILNEIAAHFNQSVINVNLEISEKLLEVPQKQRPLKISGIIGDLIGSSEGTAIEGTAILDNLEILFDMELKQDPLRLLLSNARNRMVLASWNGTYKDGRLVYAETGHQEYRVYNAQDIADTIIVCTEQRGEVVK
ncbi:ATPase AAA [Spirochaetia bacterium]|nr:ATPase AAA [Spirochaetia bacterium]